MILSEAIELANQGDHEAIRLLGQYYFEGGDDHEKDYYESKKWYTLGAEKGYVDCMMLVSILGTIIGHSLRKIGGSSSVEDVIEELTNALHWANEAFCKGEQKAKEQIVEIQGELGIAYYLRAISSQDYSSNGLIALDNLKKSISTLKPVYQHIQNAEIWLHLAFALEALCGFENSTAENDALEHSLLSTCVDSHFDTLEQSNIASVYLGVMYMEGRGCTTDYNKAVFYLQKAHNAGFDCSDLLSMFKKKIFGGYTLKK